MWRYAFSSARPSHLLAVRCVCIGVVLVSRIANAGDQPKDDDRWETVDGFAVYGYSKGQQLGYDWYKTREEAEVAKKKMEAIETTDGKYYDDVEIEPEQRRIRLPFTRPPKPTPEEPKLTRKFIVPHWVDVPAPIRGNKQKNDASVAGKRGSGNVGGAKVTFIFGEDGSFRAVDPGLNNKVIASGDWSQTGTAVSIRTPKFLYMGLVKGTDLKGKRVERGDGSSVSEWNISFSKSSDVVGTWVYYVKGLDGTLQKAWECKFMPNGEGEAVHPPSGFRSMFQYEVDGDTLSMRGPSNSLTTGTMQIDGDTMSNSVYELKRGKW